MIFITILTHCLIAQYLTEKFPDSLITIPTEQQFLLAANGQALMTDRGQFSELISLAKKNYPETSFDFLSKSIYSDPLNGEEQRACVQLIRFARALQDENPFFEPIYHQLLHLYVLSGSRLDLLSRLDKRIRGLAAGQSSLALISGYSGIGKTSLVLALQERIAHLGADFVVARCSEQDSMPYELWRDIAVAAAAKNGAPLNTLPAPIGDGHAANSVHQLTHALSAWLDNSTAPRPLVVLLDDLHWADIDSLEMLNKLTGHDQKPQILFLGTYRSEERSHGHPFYDYWPKLQRNRLFDHLHLKPLTQEDVQRLVTSYHGASSRQLAVYLFDRAEGHPLFTIELLNNLIEQNLLTQDDNGRWLPPEASVPVPIILKQLINRRVLRLGPDVERLLSTASVGGETWPLQIIEPLLDLPEERLLIALEQALAADLIAIEGDNAEIYRFSHGLIKQVLYENQLARRRKQMHKKIAAQFKKQHGSNIYLTAFHFYEAEAWKEAFLACTEAGKQAANSFANNRALDLYQKALDAAQRAMEEITPQQLLDAYEKLGQTYQVLDRQREAELTYSQMRDSARSVGNLAGEVRALVHLTMVRIAIYELNLAERTAQEALKIGEQIEDPGLKAQIHGSLAKLLVAIGKLDAFNFHINQMQQYMTEMDPASLSNAFRQQTYEAVFTGRYEEAEEFGRQSLAYAQSTAVPLYVAGGYQVLSFTQIESGKYVQAYENMRSILDFSEIADPYYH